MEINTQLSQCLLRDARQAGKADSTDSLTAYVFENTALLGFDRQAELAVSVVALADSGSEGAAPVSGVVSFWS